MIGPFRYRGASYFMRRSREPATKGAQPAATSEALQCLRAIGADHGVALTIGTLLGEHASAPVDDPQLIADLTRALLDGSVKIDRRDDTTHPLVPVERVEEQADSEGAKREWIEIELSDVDGNLISSAEIRLELPDGSTRIGRTDARGRFYVSNIDPGTCKLTFTSFPPVESSPKFAQAS